MKYAIKKKEEQEFDSTIEISGLTTEVTINSLLDHLENTQKTAKETHSSIQVIDLFLKEALEKMPQLAEIKEEHIPLASQYFMKLGEKRVSKGLLESCANTIETYTKHLEEIEKATGITCLPKDAPFQLVDLSEQAEKRNG